MPIYEFYCPDCHMIFNFFSRTIDVGKRPSCPRCGREGLEKKMSIFSISRNRSEPDDENLLEGIDESRLEKAMMSLASEAESMDEDDPRQAARFMRKLFDSAGLEVGGSIEEAISRMEAGEDPEKIEEEMGDMLDGDDIFKDIGTKKTIRGLKRKYLPPAVDETLYEL